MAEKSIETSRIKLPTEPHRLLRYFFYLIIVRPIMLIVMGMNVRNRARLPKQGPAVIVANHNSHLDAMAITTLFGMSRLHQVRAVAAADYFLKTRWLAWFSIRVLGIIPLNREVCGHSEHPLFAISNALEAGQIVVLFPEGTRGNPEKREPLRAGIAHLAKRHPEVPIFPIFMHGLGKALPRGEGLLVPFICDLFIGEAMHWTGDKSSFLEQISQTFDTLEKEANKPAFIEDQELV